MEGRPHGWSRSSVYPLAGAAVGVACVAIGLAGCGLEAVVAGLPVETVERIGEEHGSEVVEANAQGGAIRLGEALRCARGWSGTERMERKRETLSRMCRYDRPNMRICMSYSAHNCIYDDICDLPEPC